MVTCAVAEKPRPYGHGFCHVDGFSFDFVWRHVMGARHFKSLFVDSIETKIHDCFRKYVGKTKRVEDLPDQKSHVTHVLETRGRKICNVEPERRGVLSVFHAQHNAFSAFVANGACAADGGVASVVERQALGCRVGLGDAYMVRERLKPLGVRVSGVAELQILAKET